jgi:tetratricopeptide (TPR) repeat protein
MSLMTFRAASSSMTSGGPMPEMAKILAFRARATSLPCSREDALARARAFLAAPVSDRTAERLDADLGDGDVLMSICALLLEATNTNPADVAREAPPIYKWISARSEKQFFFDERDFFLGEAALLAGCSYRHLGKRQDAETWFDRADANFRHTVAPAAHLARVSYNRLALRYDQNRHEDVLELLPSTALTFQRLGMATDFSKCMFLEAMSLKMLGRFEEAADLLEPLASNEALDFALRGTALVNLGNVYSNQGSFDRALAAYGQAKPLLESGRRLSTLADLKVMFGETLRALGRSADAMIAYREAIADHVELGMLTRAAYLRVAFAEALLEAGRAREAEWEILAALPTIDDQEMVPEGFAAVSLLRESVRQRKTDPKALLDLREYLQARD